ncbi:hypothetical protein Tco_0477781 [Tanacetum coccineum]
MAIENLSINDYFQAIKSKFDRLANLGSPVKDSRLVTYAINGVRSKFSEVARIIRHMEKLPTFDEVRFMILLEESGVLDILNAHSSFHTTSSSPTVLVAMNASTARTNTMSTSGLKECRTFIVVHALMGPFDNCKTASSAPTPSRSLNVCESTRNSTAQEEDNILEKIKITVKGKIFVIRAKELFVWSPSFTEVDEKDCNKDDELDNESGEILSAPLEQNLEDESDNEAVSDTEFGFQNYMKFSGIGLAPEFWCSDSFLLGVDDSGVGRIYPAYVDLENFYVLQQSFELEQRLRS